ncbi:MAG: Hpt domain-containing protein [Proteobacteria bacterium]|nr:Hpt domain-containing protein [Pseudomonadota bacterium]MBU1736604.1 Hpt domain-containing protein [Pseudomonadota bacterium]
MVDLEWDRDFALEQAADDEEVLAELIDLFNTSAASDLEKINEALDDADPEGVMKAAHSLKGAAASLGIEGVRAIAYEIERAGREGSLEIGDWVAELEELLEVAAEELE